MTVFGELNASEEARVAFDGGYHTSPGNASSPGSASAPTQPLSVHSWRRNGVQNERIRSQQSV